MTLPSYEVPPVHSIPVGARLSVVPTFGLLVCQAVAPPSLGMGESARYLTERLCDMARAPDADAQARAEAEAEAVAMGWSVPPSARIPVALDGVRDAEWHLEPHELGF